MRHMFHSKIQNQISSVPFAEHSGRKQLEIISAEFATKASSTTSDDKLVHRNTSLSMVPKLNSSKFDRRILQLPKRKAFAADRKANQNAFPRYRLKQRYFIIDMNIGLQQNQKKIKKQYFFSLCIYPMAK